ncbi:PaaI family thioesterase [Nocardioides sp. W7]|uniref:PaaI family thioesterase n=1 Tax=Nocardioides sp. W7 TaxID=2931390 RepID=UPI001FD4CBC8|nr:PaaI family thioesterase [Nocardioides sp. W7]
MTSTPSALARYAVEMDPEHRAAALDLVDATNRLNLAVATTDLDEATLRRARTVLDELTTELGRRRRDRVIRAGFEAPGKALAAGLPYRICALNPWGVPLEVHFGADEAYAALTANALHEGPMDSVHGGVAAWLMDTMLGIIMQANGRRAVTARLEVDYRIRTPLDQPLTLQAGVTRREGRKIWVEGWIEHEGRRTVEATGLFVEVDQAVRG